VSQDIKNDEPLLIVGISGSLRDTSYTRMAVEIALEGAKEHGAEVQLIDLRAGGALGPCLGDPAANLDSASMGSFR